MTEEEESNPPNPTNVDDLLDQLEDLEGSVDEGDEQREVRKTIRMVEDMSFGRIIEKYTTRDMAQTFVGGIVFSLPMLVEGGVFEIAEWFWRKTVLGFPVLQLFHVFFIVFLTYGLIYWSDFRQVRMKKLFGIFPRRMMGVLIISLITASFLFFFWGRHTVNDPSGYGEIFGRISVVWAAAAFGGALSDILPGESQGEDIAEMLNDMLSEG